MGSWEEPWLRQPGLWRPAARSQSWKDPPRCKMGHLDRRPTALGEVLGTTANPPE